ncbi:hypothetical protein [Spiroplasma endosymbiont of Polydrusus formosus]|uniref:hypothetical protein n=1 Tax=Spiroplasma endosymbiont of Polydrusus formosus TaxID=3139326 RepID=UPI0035B56100
MLSLRKFKLLYIWFTAKSVAFSIPNEINAEAKLDNFSSNPTVEAISPIKTDKSRTKTCISKNYNNYKPKLFSCCLADNIVGNCF